MHFALEIILSSCRETTAHGIIPILNRNSWIIRIVWFVCLMTSMVVCLYLISTGIIAFLQFETVTKSEKIHLVSTSFPAVTICNTNSMLTNVSNRFVEEIFDKYGLDFELSKLNARDLMLFRYFVGTNALDPNRNDSFRQSLSPMLDEIIFSCSFNLHPCSIEEDFTWFFDNFYGNCFTFNSGKFLNGTKAPIKTTSRSGSLNGLSLELYLREPNSLASLSLSTGARIVVHNQTHFPDFHEGKLVSPGSQTLVEVNRLFSSYLPHPYSSCLSTIDMNHPSMLVKQILSTGFEYTQEDCFFACFQEYLIEQCGCHDFSSLLPAAIFSSRNIKPCLNFSEMLCAYQVINI